MERKPLTAMEKTYLPQIVTGMKVTLKNMFKPSVTLEYPDVRPAIPTKYRGAPTLVKDPNGREKCVSCQLCEFVCPPKAIRIKPGAVKENEGNNHVEKAPEEFDIHMLRCIYCGLCEEVCPENAIFLQEKYSLVGTSRGEFIHDKEKLYEMGGTLPDKHMKWDKKKEAEQAGNGNH